MLSKGHGTLANLIFYFQLLYNYFSEQSGGKPLVQSLGTQHSQHRFPQGSGDGQQRGDIAGEHTHISVVVIQLHHNAGRLLGDTGWLTKDLYLIEDEGLIPGGVQGVLLHHCLLALMQERDDGIGIWVGQVRKETRLSW